MHPTDARCAAKAHSTEMGCPAGHSTHARRATNVHTAEVRRAASADVHPPDVGSPAKSTTSNVRNTASNCVRHAATNVRRPAATHRKMRRPAATHWMGCTSAPKGVSSWRRGICSSNHARGDKNECEERKSRHGALERPRRHRGCERLDRNQDNSHVSATFLEMTDRLRLLFHSDPRCTVE